MYEIDLDGFNIEIHALKLEDAKLWDSQHRKKKGYSLLRIYILYKIYNKVDQRIKGYVIKTKTGSLLGYFTVAYNYGCSIASNSIKTFLWFMEKSEVANKIKDIAGIQITLFRIVLDVVSMELGQQDKLLWLHADPAGRDSLLNYYIDKFGFKPCQLATDMVSLRLKDDGRYLYKTQIDKQYTGG